MASLGLVPRERSQDVPEPWNCNQYLISDSICGVVFKGAEGARLARQCNEYGKSIRDAQPQAIWVLRNTADLINTELAIQEIRYALDECKADGVALWPFYEKGITT